MNSILIKPHHFIDIIKLYGSGIDRFVPDEKMGHDFYKVANEIIDNPYIDLKLTIDGDDICKPCKKYHEQCIDPLTHIQGYTSKDVYNKTLDKRIIKLYNLNDDYIEVNDMDYGIFCMHIMENPQIYENKTIKIKGKVIGRDKLIENGFVLGRQAMVCCSDDMQLLGLVCISKYAKDLIKDEWLVVDGTISLEYDESIQSNIPILHVDHLEGAKPLENEYVTFD